MKKALKITGIIFGVLVVLIVIALLLVSPIAKSYIQKHDKELIGREITMEKLRVNVLAGKVKILDLVVYEDDGVTPFFSMDHFETKIKLFDLRHKQLTVKKVLLSGMKVNIQQDRTWFNFNSLIDHFASDAPKSDKQSSDFGVLLNDILIDRSVIRYEDLSIGSDFLLNNLTIRIPTIDLSTMKTSVGLDLCIGDSATLQTQFHLSDNAVNYVVDLKLNNLAMNIIEPYLKQSLDVDSLQGRLDMELQALGNTEHILDFDLTGGISLHDLSLQDSEGYRLGVIDTIYAGIKKFNMNQNFLDLQRLYLSGIRSEYITHPDQSTNFDIVMGKKKVHTDTTIFEKIGDTIASEFAEVQERRPLQLLIEDLCLDHAHLFYADSTLPSPFQYEISDLSINSSNFRLGGSNSIRLKALMNQTGRISMQWKGDITSLENHNLTLMLDNIKFSDFSPYCIQMFGYPLEKGTLSFHSQNVITNGSLNGINKVQIADPKVGDKWKNIEPQMSRIPLKLGFYLLTDKENKVHLDLPITGNIDDPEFSYRKAIMKVLGNLLVKVATAPFRLLSSDGDRQYLSFDLLQHDFSAQEYSQLDDMAATMQDKPDFTIILDQKVNFEDLVQQFSNLQLQRDYYISLHPELDTTSIDLLTNEAIHSIKLNDSGLCEFAAQSSGQNKVSSKKEVAKIALTRYADRSAQLVMQFLERRNELLLAYLIHVKGLREDQISIKTQDMESMKAYKNDCRYEIHVDMSETNGFEEEE
ncbi:MAG: DUF748 domain-containing protein [Bacteroidales bacterium]|nr:DUF748 domain-containing protein [Bacteroidales bacterium]